MREHPDGGRTSALRIALNGVADVVLLAGDLTTHGEPEQGKVLADACAALEVAVYAVLGNHDWHANRRDELDAVLESGGIRVLDRTWHICEAGGVQVGIVGLKGFVGGFPGSHLSDFGEPLLREVYHETTLDVRALDQGLREVTMCPARIVLLHYSPSDETIAGEPSGICGYLGDRPAGAADCRARARPRPARTCTCRYVRRSNRQGPGL